MPEQKRASDPDMVEIQQDLETLRVASNDHNRFASLVTDGGLCDIPRRKSSFSRLDHRMAHQRNIAGSSDLPRDCNDDYISENAIGVCPLERDLYSNDDTFYTGLLGGNEDFPREKLSTATNQTMNTMGNGIGSFAVPMSDKSMDLAEIFGETSAPPMDVSPQIAKRKSSMTWTSSILDTNTPRRHPLPSFNPRVVQDHDDEEKEDAINFQTLPEDSGDLCSADERFLTRCPKGMASSISRPTRRVSTYAS